MRRFDLKEEIIHKANEWKLLYRNHKIKCQLPKIDLLLRRFVWEEYMRKELDVEGEGAV